MNTNSSQTNETWLKAAVTRLEKAGVASARLDCLVLLGDATGKDRGWLLAHPEFILDGSIFNLLKGQIERRAGHEPIAYIRGKSEFYGREFIVSPDTLQPRPETETMVELLKQLVDSKQLTVDSQLTIADVGTGSGCLAITAKLELPKAVVIATDIASACIKTAKQNAKKLGADIGFYQGDLLQLVDSKQMTVNSKKFRNVFELSTVNCKLSAVLANLPYVPDSHTINEAAMFEPKQAIFGGSDGLDLYRRLFDQIKQYSAPPQYILTESLPFQHEELAKIAELAGYGLFKTSDFIQIFMR